MTNRSIEMFQLTIPIQKKVKHLSDEDRYTYYMLGHIFNELMSLQKLVGFALPKHNDMRPSRLKPELSQALFLFRLACSKIWEATITLCKKEVSNTLRTLILPKMQDGAERWKTLNRAINEAKWLSELRNRLGFHFPTFEEWKPFTTPNDDWVDDVVFLGTQSGNTFYESSDSVAQHWTLHQYGNEISASSLDSMIWQMIELLRVMETFLEDAISVMIAEVILDGHGQKESVGRVAGPEHDLVSIPFWTAMPISRP